MKKTTRSILLIFFLCLGVKIFISLNDKYSPAPDSEFSNRFESTFDTIENQVAFQAEYSLKLFLPDSKKDNLLDIGSGPGLISKQLLSSYESVTALDPNAYYKKHFENIQKGNNFNYILGKFESTSITQKFNNILCSHMMYYIPQINWGENVLKMLNLLKPNGEILIVLTAPKGLLHELRMPMNPDYSHSGVMCSTLDDMNIQYTSQIFKIMHAEKDRQKFIDLINIYTIDDCYTLSELKALPKSKRNELNQLIQDFADTSYNIERKEYILNEACEYIHIKK